MKKVNRAARELRAMLGSMQFEAGFSRIQAACYYLLEEISMNGFGAVVKRMMQEKNVSPQELSEIVKVPMKSILEWTQNNRFPRDPEVIKNEVAPKYTLDSRDEQLS